MKVATVVQARTGSTRLPGKVLLPIINNLTMLQCVLERVQQSRLVPYVILATTAQSQDDAVVRVAESVGVPVYRGPEDDVLRRYIETMEAFDLDAAIRITADCPVIEATVIDDVFKLYEPRPCDYIFIEGYPRGTGDVELVSYDGLNKADSQVGLDACYREHVITFLIEHPEDFCLNVVRAPARFIRPEYRLCVDEMADLEVVRAIYGHFSPRIHFALDEVIALLDNHPEIAASNRHVKQKTR